MTQYNYQDAEFTNLTDKSVPRDSVMTLLFEETVAAGEPAIDYEVANIENTQSTETVGQIDVAEVVVTEHEEDKVVFEVHTPSVTVTAPADSTDYDTRVCHEQDIPYHYYDIALVN